MKPCFIITPIDSTDSEVRLRTDRLLEKVYTPTLTEFGFRPVISHQIIDTGSIHNQMFKHLIENELAIADLTGLNPNVLYEVGIRHSFRRKLILLMEEGTTLPFDLHSQRAIVYRSTDEGLRALRTTLTTAIKQTLYATHAENPVTQAIALGDISLPETAPSTFNLEKQQTENARFQLQLAISQSRASASANLSDGIFFFPPVRDDWPINQAVHFSAPFEHVAMIDSHIRQYRPKTCSKDSRNNYSKKYTVYVGDEFTRDKLTELLEKLCIDFELELIT
ncbi:hypothetical protein [Oceanospirillum sediminis]|uniref:Uncharacterized protein n=1 Tax=Oceanospirillum sediminis TaxID=2760088 RepID=A0A839IKT5_9GAMM|nr:hypothetical protein [Oceanospirillum sediminis]MBB1485815.1 hypothetical protein [Oceanospirillum sediminis]